MDKYGISVVIDGNEYFKVKIDGKYQYLEVNQDIRLGKVVNEVIVLSMKDGKLDTDNRLIK